jgi:hypothetical protein
LLLFICIAGARPEAGAAYKEGHEDVEQAEGGRGHVEERLPGRRGLGAEDGMEEPPGLLGPRALQQLRIRGDAERGPRYTQRGGRGE